jgi:hypothetical protein
MKLIEYESSSAVIKLSIQKGEARVICSALLDLKESRNQAGSLWINMIDSAIETFDTIERSFEK